MSLTPAESAQRGLLVKAGQDKEKMALGQNRRRLLARRDPSMVVDLARKYTKDAILKLVKLMENTGGEVPPAVQMRCAEILLERGYGKSPQAVLIGTDGTIPAGIAAVPIMERIQAIREAREAGGMIHDLEASELTELTTTEQPGSEFI